MTTGASKAMVPLKNCQTLPFYLHRWRGRRWIARHNQQTSSHLSYGCHELDCQHSQLL